MLNCHTLAVYLVEIPLIALKRCPIIFIRRHQPWEKWICSVPQQVVVSTLSLCYTIDGAFFQHACVVCAAGIANENVDETAA